ncbi:MAG: hypothetical protein NC394_06310, partial [Bacteroides sp.]|nr:hypothetical protein [Bacteroides sp.]
AKLLRHTALLQFPRRSIFEMVKFELREEYAIEYFKEVLTQFAALTGFDPETTVRGRGHGIAPIRELAAKDLKA